MIRRRLIWAGLALAALAYWWAGRPRAEAAAEPVDWRRDPIQTATERTPFTLETARGTLTLTPRAAYDIAAVVASTQRYRFDAMAFLSPLDLALTWGELPTPAYQDKVDYSQDWRAFTWRSAERALDRGYVIRHAANTHLIPANRNLERALLAIDAGDEVRLAGLLVDVAGPGLAWHTSTVRTDHGDHGCEILWVEAVERGGRRYR